MEADAPDSPRGEAGTCPTDDQLAAYVEDTLGDAEHSAVADHLDTCALCRRLVAGAARDDEPSPKARGALLGRYVVLELIGAGAMGLVYAAYDPELERKVALKLLRPDGADVDHNALRARLLREARALARFSHANVITVLDVGTLGDEVFLAMELVEGTTLRGYLLGTPRGWRERLRVFCAAGEGLRAAHGAGIVHRDFKPDNVLVGKDGRVKVTDFGLARHGDREPQTELAAADVPQPSARAILSRLTRTGAVAGTPAYMAPEQRAGGAATAASDQYAFALAVSEALLGERPDSKLVLAVTTSGARPPSALRPILTRALAPEPAARWPSMDALLAALEKLQRRPSRACWGVLATGFAGIAAAIALPLMLSERAAASPCLGSETAFATAWGPERRAATRAAFLASNVADAATVFASLDRELERYGARYRAAHQDACAAARIRRDQSEATMDRRMSCLAGRLREAEVLVRLLGAVATEPGRAARALAAAQALPEVGACAKVDVLAMAQPLPEDPGRRARIVRFEEALAASKNTVRLGEKRHGVAAFEALVEEARALGWRPGQTRALLERSKAEYGNTQVDAALRSASEAAAAALSGRDDETLADAWLLVLDIEAYRTRKAEAEHAARQAEAANNRIGLDPAREATRLLMLARLYERAGEDYDLAVSLCTGARKLLADVHGDDDLRTADVDDRLGNLKFMQARYGEALALFERAILLRTRAFGPREPSVANSRANAAEALVAMGRIPEGESILRELLAQRPDRLYVEDGLANALELRGALRQALTLREKVSAACLGTTDPCARWAPARLGELLVAMKQPTRALPYLEGALKHAAVLAPMDVARMHLALARALHALRRSPRRVSALAKAAAERITPWANRYGGPYLALQNESTQMAAP